MASSNFAGMSRPSDVEIAYYLKNEVAGDVTVRIFDGSRLVAQLPGVTKTPGINWVRWNMTETRERIPGEAAPSRGRGGAGRGGAPTDPSVVITEAGVGAYRVVLTVNGRDYTQTVRIMAGQ